MTLPRRLVDTCVQFSRAFDACVPDSHKARERVLQAAEEAILVELARAGWAPTSPAQQAAPKPPASG